MHRTACAWQLLLCAVSRAQSGSVRSEILGWCVRALMTGFAAAAVPGVASAVVTRLLMRVVAVLANTEPSFDPVASMSIGVIYVALLLPGCLALAYSRARWPWLLFGGGVAVLVFEAVAIGLQETSSAHDLTAGRWIALVLVLLVMLITYVIHVAAAARWARRSSAVPVVLPVSAR